MSTAHLFTHFKFRKNRLQDNWEWKLIEIPADMPRPTARDFLGMVALPGNRLLIFGGLDAGAKRLDDTWIFDCNL